MCTGYPEETLNCDHLSCTWICVTTNTARNILLCCTKGKIPKKEKVEKQKDSNARISQ